MEKPAFIARTLHGIEPIAADEIISRFPDSSARTHHREVWFRADFHYPETFRLRSIDDLLLVTGQIHGIDHTRNSLTAIPKAFSDFPSDETVEVIRDFRSISQKPLFTVVASFLGKRNYNRYEIEDQLSNQLAGKIGGIYQSSKAGKEQSPELTFRVHLWEDKAWLGLRVFEFPLHRRTYKLVSRTGTLHPPLAYAMAMLAQPQPGHTLLDPFCGVGTIPIEAGFFAPEAYIIGVDIDAEQISNASENASLAGIQAEFLAADAGNLPFQSGSIERIISNIPWNYTVAASGSLTNGLNPFFKEAARVLKKTGRAVLLTFNQEDELPFFKELGFHLSQRITISLFGRHPEIWVLDRG